MEGAGRRVLQNWLVNSNIPFLTIGKWNGVFACVEVGIGINSTDQLLRCGDAVVSRRHARG
jgi:hypothetical protein